jgi:hypothetical protein
MVDFGSECVKQNPETPSAQNERKETAKNKNKTIASKLPPVCNMPTPFNPPNSTFTQTKWLLWSSG